jgi:FkbH-like protein
MVHMSIPGIQCLDATNETTWRMLDWWAEALPEQIEGDRTQLYIERKARQSHIDEAAEKEGQEKLFTSLRIRVELFPARQKDLARATELINRTNQFNTGGSRVTPQQVVEWNNSPEHFILVAEAADRFGGMGIISVLVAELAGNVLTIPVWVLSCRVFGFGMESAMLRELCQLGERLGVTVVRGTIVETPNNQPCREVYGNHGFTLTGAAWELAASSPPAVPAWLTVTTTDLSPTMAQR